MGVELVRHLVNLRSSLARAETHEPGLVIVRAHIRMPVYILPDLGTGIQLLPVGAGGPRARLTGLGQICVTFVREHPNTSTKRS